MRTFDPILARLVTVVVMVVAGVTPARGLTSPQRGCQEAIARAGTQLLGRSMVVLASCHRGVARGGLPAGTDCLAATSQRRTAAAAATLGGIARACADADVVALAPGGECSGAGTVTSLVACIQASHAAQAETLIAVADPARGALSSAAQACEAEASRQTRRFALARIRLLQQCKGSSRVASLLPGTSCSAEPRTALRIASARTRAATRIAAACGPPAALGAPCDAAATAGDLAQCLLSAGEVAGDGALAAEYQDHGFCGDPADAVEARIDALVADMTLAEKVDEMHGTNLIDGVWATPGNARLGIPGFGMIDGARGVSPIAGNATCFPVGMARGATWDPALEERVGEAIGTEARARGASVILAPVVNMLRHPRWGRAQETYGEDTVHLARMGVGFVRGTQQHVIASAKHFAANSIEKTRHLVNVLVDERTLREVYLPHFRAAVQEGHAGSVMSAYNKVNGQFCGQNVHLLHDILKGDWGFPGFVESDWLGTHTTVASANAGLDVEMPLPTFFAQPLVDAVTAGTVAHATIDAAVRRILRAKLCFRLDTDPPVPDPSLVESPEHLDLALEVAREASVLLKNDDAALPLDRSEVASIVVVGDLAATANLGDTGSSLVTPSFAITPLDGILARAGGPTVTHVPGPPLSLADQATVAAADAVVVVAGLTSADEGEGQITIGDRATLGLPGGQDAMIAAVAALNPRTIVVLEGGSALTMPWVNDVAAILMAWYPGQEGGYAIADLLFGDANPSGKLPISFPVAEADLPPFDNVSLMVTYGYYHGYRWLDRNGTDPLFPFGFGLSYTTFQYANLTLDRTTLARDGHLRATADVTNTGSVAGDDVAELYVSYQGSAVDRAVRDLKAFARVHLEPGETRTVPFELRAADLAFWDTAAGAWQVEPITYGVAVGPSSRDLPLQGTFTIAP